jgi:hypothetical protein
MWSRSVLVCVAVAGGLLALWGCSQAPLFIAKDEPWRADEERQCLASGYVQPNHFLFQRTSLGGPEPCGALKPFEMTAAADGYVQLRPAAMLRCPMIPAVERWVRETVRPAARHYLGRDLVELKVAASYSCRPINHVNGGQLSEHGHANAMDISAFLLSDGDVLTVKGGWRGEQREQAFLQAVHDGACREFTTVLGPNADSHHHDHFHLDLARRGRDGLGRVCK